MELSSTGRRNRLSRSAHKEITEFPRNSGMRRPCRDGGGGKIAPFFCELSFREAALATLIDQRRRTPSCGGQAPTAERIVGPARMFAESLTPRPGIREQNRPIPGIGFCQNISVGQPAIPLYCGVEGAAHQA